jgi:uncharacterized protein (DUF1800 family)
MGEGRLRYGAAGTGRTLTTRHRRPAGGNGGWLLPVAAIAIVAGWLLLVFAVGAAPLVGPIRKEASETNVYRFYNQVTGVHFYTADEAERAAVIDRWPQLVYEGAVYRAVATATPGTTPIYRFYNTTTGAHFYTADPAEKLRVEQTLPQFVYEGIVFYAYATDAFDRLPIHRFYNTVTHTHFFTASDSERDFVQRSYPQFAYEGIAYYALPLAGDPASQAKRDAFRLLDQGSFGPTPADVARVMQIGAAAWVDGQLALPPSGYPDSEFSYVSLDENDNCKFSAARTSASYACARDQLTLFKMRRRFFQNALTAPDQLRQRVAWALSQIFVISGMKDPDMETGYVQARFHQMLAEEAFGNFGSLLKRATLSPAMGHYLDMVDNAKADPVEMTEPNENYARELLQLFAIGLVELKRDGTPLVDADGNPVPTYGQPEVRSLARALTGWTYPLFDATQPKGGDDNRYYAKPMIPAPSQHDLAAKRLFLGIELPPGQSADADLQAALNNIFLHPNVGPFIARQLIGQFVTGNPSPGYIDRVAAVFDDNGAGVRGDMKAVVRTLLLDPEARISADSDPRYGRFREPALFITAVLRTLGATSDGIGLDDEAKSMGQDVFYSPTVFNYYPAEFKIPGTSVIAPPMGIHNTNTVLARSNYVYDLLYGGGLSRDEEVTGSFGTALALAPYAALAGNPRALLAEIDARLFGGAMPPGMKSEIYDTVTALDAGDPEERARAALFLAATAFQFQTSR